MERMVKSIYFGLTGMLVGAETISESEEAISAVASVWPPLLSPTGTRLSFLRRALGLGRGHLSDLAMTAICSWTGEASNSAVGSIPDLNRLSVFLIILPLSLPNQTTTVFAGSMATLDYQCHKVNSETVGTSCVSKGAYSSEQSWSLLAVRSHRLGIASAS